MEVSNITLFVGLDVHKSFVEFVSIDEKGNVVNSGQFNNNLHDIDNWRRSLPTDVSIALEASTSAKFLYQHLYKCGLNVIPANPWTLHLISKSSSKTDEKDAYRLAQLLRLDFLPRAYMTTDKWDEIKLLVHHRKKLAEQMTVVKNEIHSLLVLAGINHSFSDLFGKKGLEFLVNLKLDGAKDIILKNLLDSLKQLSETSTKIEGILAGIATSIPEVELLMTVPGIDIFTSITILAEIGGDINRFPSAKKLCSYAGLIPIVRASGGTVKHSRITKRGSSTLRWALTTAAQSATRTRYEHRLKKFYTRLRLRGKPAKVALVATARKLLVIIYNMLINNERYRDESGYLTLNKRKRWRRLLNKSLPEFEKVKHDLLRIEEISEFLNSKGGGIICRR